MCQGSRAAGQSLILKNIMKFLVPLVLAIMGISPGWAASTKIAADGKALVPIVHAQETSEMLQRTTAELADVLGRMADAEFAVEAGGDPRGIIVGTVAEFANVPGADKLDPSDPLRLEEYIIHSDGERLWLVGASGAGARHAVWDFLHRLGYRLYFPGAEWEIVPKSKEIVADFDVFSAPDYKTRRFAWHYGIPVQLKEDVARWTVRNRLGGFDLRTNHVYGAIVKKYREEFVADPTMRSMVNGKPTSKLNPANPRTLEVLRQYAADAFEANPSMGSISMDPSDGGGWGESPEELAIGTPSDRAVFIANEVATFINEQFGKKYVGMYAYNEHSPPPQKVRVDPRVIINVATSFVHGGFTVKQLMKGWRDAGAVMLGIREYHSVVAWDRSLPGAGKAANLDYLAKSIPEFYEQGARFYITEAGLNWGPQGIGNYFTTRILWDLEEAKNKDVIFDEFIRNCFPEAKETMGAFYRNYFHPSKRAPLSRDLAGRMYRSLKEARSVTKDPAALQRLDSLLLYTRFVELTVDFSNAPNNERAERFETLIRFIYRSRKAQMMGHHAYHRDIPRRVRVELPEGTDFRVPENKNPWKSSEPFTREELDTLLAQGIENNPLLDFEIASFSKDLVPARVLSGAPGYREAETSPLFYFRSTNQIFTWVDDVSQPLQFNVKTGITYRTRGDVTVSLYPLTDTEEGTGEETDEEIPVFLQALNSVKLPPDQQVYPVEFKPEHAGGYMVETRDQDGGVHVTDWPTALPFTLEFSMEKVPRMVGRTSLAFYIPKGTKLLGFFGRGTGAIHDSNNTVVHELSGESGYVSIPVPRGEDGTFWRFRGLVGGQVRLLTVPPYMAPNPSQLMLPREVVEADK